jgi:hypothetical protein
MKMPDGVTLTVLQVDRDAPFPDQQQPSWRTLRGLPICHCNDPKLRLVQPPINDMRLDPDIVGSYCFFECDTCDTVIATIYGDDGRILNAFDFFDLVAEDATPKNER